MERELPKGRQRTDLLLFVAERPEDNPSDGLWLGLIRTHGRGVVLADRGFVARCLVASDRQGRDVWPFSTITQVNALESPLLRTHHQLRVLQA